MGAIDIRRFPSAQELADTAAADCVELLRQSSSGRVFALALSGGRIARNFCSALAAQIRSNGLAVQNLHFFWSDERCVPPEDAESNFRLAKDSLLRPLGIPAPQIHRLEGEKPPEQAFSNAVADLRQLVSWTDGQPVLDLVLLGMGEDGHVASLFPGEPAQMVADPAVFRRVTAVKPPPLRLTLGYRAIAAARNVWVLASGAGKAGALAESLQPNGRTPLARVLQMRAATRIYSDIPDGSGQ